MFKSNPLYNLYWVRSCHFRLTAEIVELDLTYWQGATVVTDFKKTFFNVRVFNSNAASARYISIEANYKIMIRKKQKYKERIQQIGHASSTPPVFSCTGGCSKFTNTFVKHLASMLAEKLHFTYNMTINWL